MTVLRGFFITIASSMAFSGLGALLGYLLAVILPDYYRTVFHIPPEIPIDPVQVGLGLGITQGFAAGLIVGLVIVVTVAWFNSCLADGSVKSHSNRGE